MAVKEYLIPKLMIVVKMADICCKSSKNMLKRAALHQSFFLIFPTQKKNK